MRVTVMAIIVSLFCALGCEKSTEAPANEEGGRVDINAPGVDVKVDREDGVDVKTPAVDVEADPKGNTDVKVDGGE